MSDAPIKKRLSVLHAHSVYSLLDGASDIAAYLKWCKETGAPALALTDHGWQIGNLELYEKARKAGVTPIPGCEFYIAYDKTHQFVKRPRDYAHVTAWAINEQGYRNLMKLGSISWNKDTIPGFAKNKGDTNYRAVEKDRVVVKWGTQQKPRITLDELLTYNEGLVLGSGCLIGLLSSVFLNGEGSNQAEYYLGRLLEVYKGRLFMEIMPHICDHDYNRETKRFEKNECTDWSPDGDVQRSANLEIIGLAKKHRLPLLMTTDAHFTTPDMKKIQDILLTQGEPDGWKFYNSYHCMQTEEAWEHWSEVMGDDVENKKIFSEAVENNDVIAEMAKGLVIKDRYHQPKPEIPIEIQAQPVPENDKIKATVLHWVDYHGRMKWENPEWIDRLMMELKVICDNGIENLGPYFLFLEKQARWAAEHSIFSAPGRGSGAGSLLCYLLKITHLDPFRFGLPFSRFLSDSRIKRGKLPDIDWDMGNRDPLVAYLRETLGDMMAQCSTLHTLKVKSAIKDACRSIMGWNSNDPRVDAITKLLPKTEPTGVASKDVLTGYSDSDGNVYDGWIFQYPALDEFFKEYPQVYEAVIHLLGIPRAASRHASAYLVSDEAISNSVPTCTISGVTCTQYNANAAFNAVEKAGLIKFDFLRVNTLDDISNCIRLVQKRYGYEVWEEKLKFADEEFVITRGDLPIDKLPLGDGTILDIYELPDDPEVYQALSGGHTETVFQMNSALMTGFTKRIKPKTLMDLSDIVALVRPGPLEAEVGELDKNGKPLTMTEAYIARRHGDIPVRYAHPGMEPILKDTYGVAVYQEQLQQMFQDLAGYNSEEADELREILAKKKKQELEKRIPQLRERLAKNGWNEKQIDVFVSLCIASSAYSFNRAHSAAYGTVAYQSAYLKTKFPLEWWTAVLQNAKIDDIRDKDYASTLLKQGILQLPHVNGPTDTFRLEDGKVHAPLYLIDRVADSTCLAVSKEREANGPFESMQDFFERIPGRAANEGVMHNLILCGAFDAIEPGKKPQELIEEYHYMKKVSTLAIGRDKTGEDLKAAVLAYKQKEIQKGVKLEIPALFLDDLQTEIMRVKALSIYRVDVHSHFKELMHRKGVNYTSDGKAFIGQGTTTIPLFKTLDQLEMAVRDENTWKGPPGAWAGFIQGSDTFQYTDKKTGQKVTALKLQITNNGETVEAVLWPSLYQQIGQPDPNKIVFVVGNVKESFEPGKYSFSVSQLKYA